MLLTVKNLTLKRGPHMLVHGLNFTLAKGQSLLLKGPNGIGKTTLIRALAGLAPVEEGEITLTSDHADQTKSHTECLHYIGHKNGFRTSLTVYENLHFWSTFFEGSPNSKTKERAHKNIKAVAQTFSLLPLLHIPAGYLSQGQQRRLGLARLAVKKRPLWLLDEPTVSLDQNSTKLVAEQAQAHINAGGSLITATHIPIDIPFTQTIELTRPKTIALEEFI